MKKMIFIGASGMLGKPVAKELIKAGYDVTLLARDVNKMQQLFSQVKIIQGDILNKESLTKAFAGQEIVYLNLSVAQASKKNDRQPEREGIANIIETAKQTGIKRIVYLSSLVKNYQDMNNFKWWAFDIKHKAVNAIRSSGILYSIFYPSTFMECLDQQLLQGKKIMLVSGAQAKMWFVAAHDYGRQVANAIEIAGNNNQEYSVQGMDAYDCAEAAKVFISHYKIPVKTLTAPLGLLKFLGFFSQKINYGAHICEALNKYPEKFESENTWTDLGKPEITLAEYVKSL